jgi:hypothetical protein
VESSVAITLLNADPYLVRETMLHVFAIHCSANYAMLFPPSSKRFDALRFVHSLNLLFGLQIHSLKVQFGLTNALFCQRHPILPSPKGCVLPHPFPVAPFPIAIPFRVATTQTPIVRFQNNFHTLVQTYITID